VHRSVERLIGRLVTDESFRASFRRDPHAALVAARACGIELNSVELRAMLATDTSLWERVAHSLDPRLQKVDLHTNSDPILPSAAETPARPRRRK
jgi:hypothetical protein